MPAWLVYLVTSTGWALAGLLGGYVIGHAARDWHNIAETVATQDTQGPSTVDKQTGTRCRVWWPPPSGDFLVGVLVVLLGVATVAQGITTNNETTRITQCQAHYANGFADALDARQQATADAQNALDALIGSISKNMSGGNRNTRAQTAQAITHYLALRQQVKRQQATHPYPPPPRESCP